MRTIKAQLESNLPRWKDSPQLWDLRRACIQNAIDLLNEARILYKHRRYARAFALAYTAYEEFGKGQIVSDFITGIASEDEFWAAFRRHDLKSAYNRRYVSIHVGQPIQDTVEYDIKSEKTLFETRKRSMYVDCSSDYTPSTPTSQITSSVAKEAIEGISKHISSVLRMEQFNERIGTQALAK